MESSSPNPQKIFIKSPILCDNFTLETGFSITGNLFVIARNSITINGNISASNYGSSGGNSTYFNGQSGIIIDANVGGAAGGGGFGGAAGGMGYGGGGGWINTADPGGNGGGYVILIAPTITIGEINITANGSSGNLGSGGGAGGIICIQYFDSLVNNAASITATGGNGASNGLVKIEQITY